MAVLAAGAAMNIKWNSVMPRKALPVEVLPMHRNAEHTDLGMGGIGGKAAHVLQAHSVSDAAAAGKLDGSIVDLAQDDENGDRHNHSQYRAWDAPNLPTGNKNN